MSKYTANVQRLQPTGRLTTKGFVRNSHSRTGTPPQHLAPRTHRRSIQPQAYHEEHENGADNDPHGAGVVIPVRVSCKSRGKVLTRRGGRGGTGKNRQLYFVLATTRQQQDSGPGPRQLTEQLDSSIGLQKPSMPKRALIAAPRNAQKRKELQ